MVFADFQINQSYWESFTITQADIEFLYAYLLDKETPLPSDELAEALIQERIRSEKNGCKRSSRKR